MRNLKDLTKEELTSLIEKYLFEPNDKTTRNAIKEDIAKLLEGKIHLEDDTTPEEIDKGTVAVVTVDGHRLSINVSGNYFS